MQFNPHFLLIINEDISDDDIKKGWQNHLESCYGTHCFRSLKMPKELFGENKFEDWYLLKHYFNCIVEKIDEHYQTGSQLRELTVIIPLETTDPIEDGSRWNPCNFQGETGIYYRELLFSWLFLTFPEVRFVFYREQETKWKDKKEKRSPSDLHLVSHSEFLYSDYLQETGFNVMLDPAGWRNAIRSTLLPNPALIPVQDHPVLWGRDDKKLAVIIEDEKVFSSFYSYTAYRYGCRTWLARNMKQLNLLFGKEKMKETGGDEKNNTDEEIKPRRYDINFHFSLEDLNLGLQDKPTGTHLSDIARNEAREKSINLRGTYLPGTERIKNRYLVSYGQTKSGKNYESPFLKTNLTLKQQKEAYNSHNKDVSRIAKIIYKPLVSVGKLSKDCKFDKHWKKTLKSEEEKRPKHRTATSGGHSASGMLMEIARILLDRADRIFDEKVADIQSVPDLFHTALLALEAKELLGGRTPSIFIEALAAQHRAEVYAECRCYGTAYELDVTWRINEIHKEVESICKWYREKQSRKLAVLSTEQLILDEIAGIYQKYHQIDERATCLVKIRELNRKLQYKHHYFPALSELVWLFRWYLEQLQKSFKYFFGILILWYFFMFFLWSMVLPSCGDRPWDPFDLFVGFLDPGTTSDLALKFSSLTIIQKIVLRSPFFIGLFHLGYLLTALFDFVLRKD